MLRALLAAALIAGPGLARAQDAETLADIRQQLSVLQVEMQRLRGELNTTGGANVAIGGSSVLERVDAIEAELRRLTQATERTAFRVESVARDGGNRIEDLRFQLCELTADCDLGALPEGGPLGGEAAAVAPAAPAQPLPGASGGPELAMGKQAEFDAALAALEAGRNAEAAEALSRFVTAYPTGPLSGRAQLLLGRALATDGQDAAAARAYLEAFSGAPEGPDAPEALLGLGQALGQIGQTDEACLTLSEIALRFPGSEAATRAGPTQAALGCL
jgi:tol-pal system protein YbgF